MKNLLTILLLSILSFHLFTTSAEAKRFGGGRSFGVARSVNQYSRPTNSGYQQPAAPANNTNRWLGPLAGFAAGGLLASLFGHGGGGGGMLSILMVVGLGLMLFRMLQSRGGSSAQFQANPPAAFSPAINSSIAQPSNFTLDETAFLRQAKSSFIRLQTAYDNKNLSDIREFTTPEVFAEIQMQLHERGDAVNQTDVLNVEAQLLDHAEENQVSFASVLFTAQLREEQNAAVEMVKEVWHFRKDVMNSGWVVAGIQQQ